MRSVPASLAMEINDTWPWSANNPSSSPSAEDLTCNAWGSSLALQQATSTHCVGSRRVSNQPSYSNALVRPVTEQQQYLCHLPTTFRQSWQKSRSSWHPYVKAWAAAPAVSSASECRGTEFCRPSMGQQDATQDVALLLEASPGF